MNDAIHGAKRRLVAIVDPHIRANNEYHVYREGMELQGKKTTDGYMQNIFIRDAQAKAPWEGHCWPGTSVWMDFLNEQA